MNLNDLRIHIMGIGGAGMSAIARVLHQRGVRVSGDDRADSPVLQRCAPKASQPLSGMIHAILKVRRWAGQWTCLRPRRLSPKTSRSCSRRANAGLHVWHRGDLLNALLQDKTAIAVAGTHGKSTTTAMIAMILQEAGLDPSYIVGATAPSLGVNARHGAGG